jgi:hypothetical protein
MCAPRRLTDLWASTACYRVSFTLPDMEYPSTIFENSVFDIRILLTLLIFLTHVKMST